VEVPRDGRPANIGVEKTARRSHSNYKADVYEAWQLWLERDDMV